MSTPKKVILAAVVVALAVCTALFYFVWTRMWQRWDMDPEWANQIMIDSQEIRQLLDDYKSSNGEFPDSLSLIHSSYRLPAGFGDPHSEGKWIYRKLNGSDYQLFATGASWVSSFDAMVIRDSGEYPDHWFQTLDSSHAKQFGDWYYITGFSSIADDP